MGTKQMLINQLLKELAFMPNGTMRPTIVILPGKPYGEVVFVIKEDKYHIKKIAPNPSISIRNSIIETDEALGFLNMFMFSDNKELIYDCWLNYNNMMDRLMIEMLCTQDSITFEYRDNSLKINKKLSMQNGLVPFAIRYIEHSKAYRNWDDTDFEILKNSIDQKYSIYIDLWNELEII